MTNYLEYRRALKNGQASPPKKKKPAKIRQVSKKRAKINREYAEKSRPFWKGKDCAVRSPGCQGKATGIHHLKGKSSTALLMDERYWIPACTYCNLIWVEENDAEARKLGFKLSRIKK